MRLWQWAAFAVALMSELLLFAALNLFDDWTLEQMPVRFVATAIGCGIGFLIAAPRFPTTLSPRLQVLLFWGIAVALRVAALPLAPGDDFWRYQWEGKIQQAGYNPYLQAPDDPALEPLRAGFEHWYKINHREFSAIYPPGAELLFATLSRVSDNPVVYKILFAAADLGSVAVLLLLIGGGAARYATAAWYAWNPLVAYSFAGAAHFDSLMILPMLAGVFFLVRSAQTPDRRQRWTFATVAAALLGIAISIKLVPLLLLPLAAFALRSRAVVLALSVAIIALLASIYGWPQVPIWTSLREFARITRLNDLFWWLVEETVWPNPRQKNYRYNLVIGIAAAVVSLVFARDWKRGMLWVLGTALILSPVLHPWYCTWILPFAAWRRAAAWQVLSVTLFAYYLFWNERLFALPWHAEPWLRGIIILPPLVATISLLMRSRSSPTPA